MIVELQALYTQLLTQNKNLCTQDENLPLNLFNDKFSSYR